MEILNFVSGEKKGGKKAAEAWADGVLCVSVLCVSVVRGCAVCECGSRVCCVRV